MRAAWREWMQALHAELAVNGLSMGLPELAQRCDGFFSRAAPSDCNDELTVFERRVARLMAEMELEPKPDTVRQTAAAALGAWLEHVSPDPEAEPVLKRLAAGGHPLAVVSNFDHPPAVTRALEEASLLSCFDHVIVSGAVGVAKPEPRIFELALARTGEVPHHAVHVGDSRDDLLGAERAGLRCVLLRRPGDTDPAEHVDYDAESPGQATARAAPRLEPAARIKSLRNLPDLLGDAP
jgi:HAD superfamily hydrolase (TIGR01509 family)